VILLALKFSSIFLNWSLSLQCKSDYSAPLQRSVLAMEQQTWEICFVFCGLYHNWACCWQLLASLQHLLRRCGNIPTGCPVLSCESWGHVAEMLIVMENVKKIQSMLKEHAAGPDPCPCKASLPWTAPYVSQDGHGLWACYCDRVADL